MPRPSTRMFGGWIGAAVVAGVLCACTPAPDAGTTSSPTPAPLTSSIETPAPAPSTPAEPSTPARSDDICALLTADEITAVIGAAYPAAIGTFGSLADPTGGQCLWTNDPEGDVFTDDGSTLELIAFVPDGPNPPPADAPAVGSSTIVPTDSGSMFASGDHVLWIRVTGALSVDAVAVEAARALIPAVLSRL